MPSIPNLLRTWVLLLVSDLYYNNAEILNNWIDSADLPLLSDAELKFYLENQGQLDKDYGNDVEGLPKARVNALEPVFPQLSEVQRKFGVNPSYQSFYDPSFRQVEGVADDILAPKQRISSPTDEVVDDILTLVEDDDRGRQSAKKASQQAFSRSSVSRQEMDQDQMDDLYFTTIVGVSSALAVFAIVGAGFCYHRVRRNSKASEDVEYPAYGVTGPGGKETSPTSGTDRKLAQNAQMYHYQHQKQQMIAFDSANGLASEKRNGNASDCESDEGEEGDYTVYECPGLAPAGEMEVHNPLFQDDDSTPKASK
ncbi:hypothetical protein TCAL_10998 [Tigriopus californicus]|uniref:Neural proliferation differentiation and control protein 1 n=1 Tax=Tigriopus californicus TaxID=6832 RepID=A0A553NBD8_TIGCA|nr:hypothetical protein TCAL_10998 [Tigriopus californicus]